MAHHVSALVVRAPYAESVARQYELHAVPLEQGVVVFPLNPDHLDAWSDRLGVAGCVSDRPVLNLRVVHHFAQALVGHEPFAVIETDYFGGVGDQAAAVYRSGIEVMPPAVSTAGPINEALRHLGVLRGAHFDEFEAVGLTRHRSFENAQPGGSVASE